MTIQELKAALSTVWALVYRATQVDYLPDDQIDKLKAAISLISDAAKDRDDYFGRRAPYMVDCINLSGIFSVFPRKKLSGTEEILSECERLQRSV